MPEPFSLVKVDNMTTVDYDNQTAGDHDQSLGTALKNNVRPIGEIDEIKGELGNIGTSVKRFIHAYSPIYDPVINTAKAIPCGIAKMISKTICLPNHLLGKIFHPGGTFSTVKKVFSKVAGFPCHVSQYSASTVCHPSKTFSKIMKKVRGGGIKNYEAGSEFDFIYCSQDSNWYPIESKRGRRILENYLTFLITIES